MTAEERRRAVWQTLSRSPQPVSATALAQQYGVSRQIIVGDVALLRAAGEAIDATPRGYVVRRGGTGLLRQAACRHAGGHILPCRCDRLVNQSHSFCHVVCRA